MSEFKITTKDRILFAAVSVIEKAGISELTTRAVANEAGVNVAAINYHFGSKENLLQAVLAYTMDNAFSDHVEKIKSGHITIARILKELLAEWIEGAITYPEIMKAHLYGPIFKGDYETLFIERLNSLVDLMREEWKKMEPELEDQDLAIRLIQIFSSVMFPVMAPKLFQKSGIDFHDEKTRSRYLAHLLGGNLFPSYQE